MNLTDFLREFRHWRFLRQILGIAMASSNSRRDVIPRLGHEASQNDAWLMVVTINNLTEIDDH